MRINDHKVEKKFACAPHTDVIPPRDNLDRALEDVSLWWSTEDDSDYVFALRDQSSEVLRLKADK